MTKLKITSDDGNSTIFVSLQNLVSQLVGFTFYGKTFKEILDVVTAHQDNLDSFKKALVQRLVLYEGWTEDRALWNIEKAKKAMDNDTIYTPISTPVDDKCTGHRESGQPTTTELPKPRPESEPKLVWICDKCKATSSLVPAKPEIKVPEKINVGDYTMHQIVLKVNKIIDYLEHLEAHNRKVK